MFLCNNADLRYKITKDKKILPAGFHKKILESKNFMELYEYVFKEIDKLNESSVIENFKDEYLRYIKKLDFPKVDSEFRLIEQNTLSVFVPVVLPLMLEDEDGKPEPFFSNFEIGFLRSHHVLEEGEDEVSGEMVWELYLNLMKHPSDDFIAKKIERKAIQGILSKFTFSMFDSDKIRAKLRTSSDEEKSFENYFYLHRWELDGVYDLESGLNETKLNSSFI
jgi:CRISPR-associated endonuclease/helicase Cas3